jgi:hypothetical protein
MTIKSDYLFNLLTNSEFLSDDIKDLISKELINTPKLLVDFLYNSTFLKSEEIKANLNKLINLQAFNDQTIQQSASKQIFNTQQNYSVIYLLLASAENRDILKENPALCDLIGEKLSEDLLKQFKYDSHEGILYYLLTNELGQEILKHTVLQKKIEQIDKTDGILSKQIVNGPYKGRSFCDLYEHLFPNTLHETLTQLSMTKK